MAVNIIEKTAEMGVAPLEAEYRRIKDIDSNITVNLRSVLRINSLDVGTLYPEQYGMVSGRNIQGVRLATWMFKKVLEDTEYIFGAGFKGSVSVYFPTKMLLKGDVTKLYTSASDIVSQSVLKRIRPEFSADLLLADSDKVISALSEFKNMHNIETVLSGFGDEFCPVLRLSGLPISTVILSRQLSSENNIASAKAGSAIKLINDLNMECVMEGSETTALEKGVINGCGFYCSTATHKLKRVVS